MKSQMIPSHHNSTNERRTRRANVLATKPTNESPVSKIYRVANALVALGCVTKTTDGYLVTMPRIGKYERAFNVIGGKCECLGDCEHIIAAELFAAKEERETAEFLNWCETESVKHYTVDEVDSHYETKISEPDEVCSNCGEITVTKTDHYLCRNPPRINYGAESIMDKN